MNPGVARTANYPAALSGLAALLECMRPVQWLKNGFVLAPLVFSSNLAEPQFLFRALAAFGVFCLSASGIYLWNDVFDWRSDLKHPEKCRRPIPSGRLAPGIALTAGSILLIAALAWGFTLNRPTGFVVSSYVAVSLSYSLFLKHTAIVDLMCIALGFVFRVVTGSTAIGVSPSHWLLMCTFLLALFLGIAKRRQEIVTLNAASGQHRRVLADYSLPWLDQAGTIVSGATVVAYALYTVSPETQARFHTDHLIYTLPFVLFGILRYLHMIHNGDRTGNPTSALIADRQLLLCVAGWFLACTGIIYL